MSAMGLGRVSGCTNWPNAVDLAQPVAAANTSRSFFAVDLSYRVRA